MVSRKAFKSASILVALVLVAGLVAGCATPTPTPAPTQPPAAPTKAPAAEPTKAPASQPTQAPAAPTVAPTAKPVDTTAAKAFFKGKQVSLIVPHGAGGGYDTYARLLAPYIEKQLGCTIVVDNVTGAGGNVGRNKVWNAKPDGLTLGFTSGTGMVYSQISGAEGVSYDVTKITWLSRVLGEPSVLVVPAKGQYQTIDAMMKAGKPVKFAVSGVGDDDFFGVGIEGKALGIDFLPVTGYNGTKEAQLAVVTGEVDAFQTSVSTMLPMIKDGSVKPIMVIYPSRVPDLPDVPTALEVAKDKADAVKLLQTPANLMAISRIFFAPPGMADDVRQALEDAIALAMKDPDLVSKAKSAGRPLDYMSGADASKAVSAAMAQASTITPVLKEILKKAQ